MNKRAIQLLTLGPGRGVGQEAIRKISTATECFQTCMERKLRRAINHCPTTTTARPRRTNSNAVTACSLLLRYQPLFTLFSTGYRRHWAVTHMQLCAQREYSAGNSDLLCKDMGRRHFCICNPAGIHQVIACTPGPMQRLVWWLKTASLR